MTYSFVWALPTHICCFKNMFNHFNVSMFSVTLLYICSIFFSNRVTCCTWRFYGKIAIPVLWVLWKDLCCLLQSFYLYIYLFTHSFILIFISTASAPHWGLQHPNPLLSPRILHRCLTAVRWETRRERPYRLHRLFLGTHHCHKACVSLADLVF